MDISVLVPLYNEEDSLRELTAWIDKVMVANKFSYELLFVDDGSTDRSWSVIEKLSRENENVRGIKFRRNYGKSAALHCGFQEVEGDVVFTMDADLQDSPDEIPEMYAMLLEENLDIVSGWKKKRYDPITKTIPTKLYNGVTRMVTGIKLHDMNCGLKVYRKQVVKSIEVYGEMHRYIPVIAKWAGFKKIGEKVVQHRRREYGVSKFGMSRFINGFLDLISITFTTRFARKPMHFFGLWGTLLFLAGFIIGCVLAYEKIFNQVYNMTDRPLFYLGLLCMVLGTQLFTAGFIADLVSRSSSDRNTYLIDTKI